MKESRLYGLFEKQDGQWVRLYPTLAYRKTLAVKTFQNALLAGVFGGDNVKGLRELRVVKDFGFCHE